MVYTLYKSYKGFLVDGGMFWAVGGERIEEDAKVEDGTEKTFGVLLGIMPDFDKSYTLELFFTNRLSSPNLSNAFYEARFGGGFEVDDDLWLVG